MKFKEILRYVLPVLVVFMVLSCSDVQVSKMATPTESLVNEKDWSQWRGPERTGLSKETGLIKVWPTGGPKLVWSAQSLGEGYGSAAISGNRVLVQGTRKNRSVLFCLNKDDGSIYWVADLGDRLEHGRGHGPRVTPTIDGDRIYALTENGDLASIQSMDGKVLWQRNILKEFNGNNPNWLISESPLVDDHRLIVSPGGEKAGVVALEKESGKTLWTTKELSDQASYSSSVIADVQGIRSLMTFTSKAAVGISVENGKLLWRYEPVANRTANVTTPIFYQDKVFYSSAYGTGCALLQLKATNGSIEAKEIYFNRDMMNHHGGIVLVNGYLYGFSNSVLTCMEFNTGKVMWKDRSVGKGSITYADGHLYLFSEKNVVGLVEANPEGYKEKGRFEVEDQEWPTWAHPVINDGQLYIRNQEMLYCYNLISS